MCKVLYMYIHTSSTCRHISVQGHAPTKGAFPFWEIDFSEMGPALLIDCSKQGIIPGAWCW